MKYKYIGKDHTIISINGIKGMTVSEGDIIEDNRDDISYFTQNGFIIVEQENKEIVEIAPEATETDPEDNATTEESYETIKKKRKKL